MWHTVGDVALDSNFQRRNFNPNWTDTTTAQPLGLFRAVTANVQCGSMRGYIKYTVYTKLNLTKKPPYYISFFETSIMGRT